jgi:hypothetical protein
MHTHRSALFVMGQPFKEDVVSLPDVCHLRL